MTASDEITQAANAVSESLDAMVFVYSGDIDSAGFASLLKSIQRSDEQPYYPNAVMLLTTHGGLASQAYRIARLIQNITKDFYLCLPAGCKSAGTLIALGASQLFMSAASELGPLDVQLSQRDEIGQRRSGMVVRTALDGLRDETYKIYEDVLLKITAGSRKNVRFEVASRIAATIAIGVMTPVYAQIDPETLGSDLRDLSIATAYGKGIIYQSTATSGTIIPESEAGDGDRTGAE